MIAIDDLLARMHASIDDARRAASPGSIGESADRPGEVVAERPASEREDAKSPAVSPLETAIEGPGFFVLSDAGGRAYGRLGDFTLDPRGTLVDGRGRTVLGFQPDAKPSASALGPIRIGSRAAADARHVRIDAQGNVFDPNGTLRGTIAVAVFTAPGRLARVSETTLTPTPASGRPVIAAPGSPNVGALRSHALETGAVDLHGDLAELWRLRTRADLAWAAASAIDAGIRTAIGLVR